MKILKQKNFSRIYSIMTAFAIMFVSLFSLTNALTTSAQLFSGQTEQTNAISNYDIALNEADVNNAKLEVSNALDYVVISQTGTTLTANNFRQISLTTTTPDADDPTDETKYTINPEKVVSVAYVVGAFTIWPQTEIVSETEQCKEFSLTVIPLNTQTLVEEIASKATMEINNSYGLNLPAFSKSAPVSSDALYQATITDSELNDVTFYIYQAPNLNYDNYGLVWQKAVQTNNNVTHTNISNPVEYQTYDSGYADANNTQANNGYLVLQLDYNLLASNLNENLNTLYLDFWHNGQAFSLRIENNGTGLDFYNNYANSLPNIEISGINITANNGKLNVSNIIVNNVYTIKFNESGEYKVRIYDNTLNRISSKPENGEVVYTSLNTSPTSFTGDLNNTYSLANFKEHNFTVVNRSKLDGFYATAKTYDNSGNQIYIINEIDYSLPSDLNKYYIERTNKNVTLDFYNLSAIESITCEIYAIEAYGIGKIVNQIDITNTDHVSAQVSDEGDYFYHIEYKNGYDIKLYTITKDGDNTIVTTNNYANGLLYKTICFELIKGVRAQYEFTDIKNGSEVTIHYPTNDDIVEVNKILTKNLQQNYTTRGNNTKTYIFFEGLGDQLLFGYNTSSFILNIAQSSPTISGIANNKSTNDKVDLTLTGVATDEVGMRISVYKDGKNIKNFDIKNENPSEALTYELSYTDLGSYRVVLTDAMNNSTEVRFAITQRQNAASIILIIVGVALAATVVILIVRVRSKVSVR